MIANPDPNLAHHLEPEQGSYRLVAAPDTVPAAQLLTRHRLIAAVDAATISALLLLIYLTCA